MSLLFVPWYIKYIGIEAYGIIGFFVSVQSVLYLLDLGLSSTFSREMASLSSRTNSSQSMRDLTCTFATIYWGIALVSGILFATLAPVFTNHWLRPEHLSKATITYATVIMGLSMVIRLPGNIYLGGLTALQRQIEINILSVLMGTLRGLGAVAVLYFVSPTLIAFFCWQLFVNFLNMISLRLLLRNRLSVGGQSSKFDLNLVRERWRFAVGMSGISILSLMLTQLDKLLLSRIVSLKEFGYYAIASIFAGFISMIVGPITSVFYPRFVSFVAKDDRVGLSHSFHDAAQLISFLLVPIVITVAYFAKDILFLWTRNSEIAEHAYVVLILVILGSMFHAFMHAPYYVQIANGWTSFAFWYNLVSLIILIPLIFYLTKRYGIVGGASTWAIYNFSYPLIGAHIMFQKYLIGEKMKWYFWSIFIPLLLSLGAVILVNFLFKGEHTNFKIAIRFSSAVILGYLLLAGVMPVTRKLIKTKNWSFKW